MSSTQLSTTPFSNEDYEIGQLLAERERRQISENFNSYAANNLRIRTKNVTAGEGALEPFRLNRVQLHIHLLLQKQLEETGKIRAIILKGRQQGCSTYVEGRFYWRTTHNKGVRTFILTHEQAATDNLFEMTTRYWENDPDHPPTRAANAKELDFSALDSGYRVSTAGTRAAGRSGTIQYFHGSEVAFWPNADDHAAGVMQAIPDAVGTEVILESTANGMGNLFHLMWQDAEAGLSEYIPIFIPWFWQSEYRIEPKEGVLYELDDDEIEYRDLYDLELSQMLWRRNKIVALQDINLFQQEYPATATEAFNVSTDLSYIKASLVARARKTVADGFGPLVMGADPARYGNDRFSIAYRQGRKVRRIESKIKLDVVEGANWCKQQIDHHKPAKFFIDVGGLGAGTFDILCSWGEKYKKICVPVNFGGAPQEPDIWIKSETGKKMEKRPGPKDRRTEMWMRSRDWLEQVGGADIPDSDSLQSDAVGPHYKYDMNQRIKLESKDDMRARGIRSPDEWDAIALTFAEPVTYEVPKAKPKFPPRAPVP